MFLDLVLFDGVKHKYIIQTLVRQFADSTFRFNSVGSIPIIKYFIRLDRFSLFDESEHLTIVV